jgi:hypothetical protein
MTAYIRVSLIDSSGAPVRRSVCVDNNCVRIGTAPWRNIIPVEQGIHSVWLDGVQDYYYPDDPPQVSWHGDIQTLDVAQPLLIAFKVNPSAVNPIVKNCCENTS